MAAEGAGQGRRSQWSAISGDGQSEGKVLEFDTTWILRYLCAEFRRGALGRSKQAFRILEYGFSRAREGSLFGEL